MTTNRWVHIFAERRPTGGYFEEYTPVTEDPPGPDWVSVPEEIIDLMHEMQSAAFRAENALRNARGKVHDACDEIARAQGAFR